MWSAAASSPRRTVGRVSSELYFRERQPWRTGLVRLDGGPVVIAHLHGDCAVGDRVALDIKLDPRRARRDVRDAGASHAAPGGRSRIARLHRRSEIPQRADRLRARFDGGPAGGGPRRRRRVAGVRRRRRNVEAVSPRRAEDVETVPLDPTDPTSVERPRAPHRRQGRHPRQQRRLFPAGRVDRRQRRFDAPARPSRPTASA